MSLRPGAARVALTGLLAAATSPALAQTPAIGSEPSPASAPSLASAPTPRDPLPKTLRAPYLDSTLRWLSPDGRIESSGAVGLELGFYLERMQVSARMSAGLDPNAERPDVPAGYDATARYVVPPRLLFTGGLGYALWADDGFVVAPGLIASRTQNPAYGYSVGVNIPALWVTQRHRWRVGFEVGYRLSFGGYLVAECSNTGESSALCIGGTRRRLDVKTGGGPSMSFVLGFELGS